MKSDRSEGPFFPPASFRSVAHARLLTSKESFQFVNETLNVGVLGG